MIHGSRFQLLQGGTKAAGVRVTTAHRHAPPPLPRHRRAGDSASSNGIMRPATAAAAAAGAGGAAPAEATMAAAAAEAATADVAAAFKRLQNGSDIRGVAMQADPSHVVTLTPAAVFFIGRAFVRFLRLKRAQSGGSGGNGGDGVAVAIGSDPRLSAALLRGALVAGLADEGARVVDGGLATTPAMFYSIVAPGSDVTGSIMLTASHMPLQNNGLKFFTAAGGLEKADIAAILSDAASLCGAEGVAIGDPTSDFAHVLGRALARRGGGAAPVTQAPLLETYAAHLRSIIIGAVNHPQSRERPLEGLKIVVDAGNGSGGFFAEQVLAPLGADVRGSVCLEPDGRFPNHIPNPEAKEAMDSGIAAVKAAGADLGVVLDTDVDRSAIVDSMGNPINSNRFIALMAAIVLRDKPGTTVVTDSVTSNGLTDFIASLGGTHCRYKRGYRNVINKGVELNATGEADVELMMETSGHGALRENRYLDDGAYLAVKAVIELVRLRLSGCDITSGGCDLTALLRGLKEPASAAEHRIKIKAADFKPVAADVLADFKAWIEAGAGGAPGYSLCAVNHEGWRVDIDEGGGKRGWALLRASLHDPLLVLNVESDQDGGAAAIGSHLLRGFLAARSGELDLGALEGAVGGGGR